MRRLLTALVAGGFVAVSAGAGLACSFHSAEAEHNRVVAQSQAPVETTEEEAISTHDPAKVKLEEATEAASE